MSAHKGTISKKVEKGGEINANIKSFITEKTGFGRA